MNTKEKDSKKSLVKPIGPYRAAVKSGNYLFCSGQIPLDGETGEIVGTEVKAQTEQVIKNLVSLLGVHGLGLQNVQKTTCFLQSMDDFAAFNEVYANHFSDPYPARSCVEVSKLPRGVLVEVEAIAEFAPS